MFLDNSVSQIGAEVLAAACLALNEVGRGSSPRGPIFARLWCIGYTRRCQRRMTSSILVWRTRWTDSLYGKAHD
jgi:hypothetical protein